MQKQRQYLCLGAFRIVTYESSIPTNWCFLAFYVWSVNCGNCKSYFGLCGLSCVDSAYITGYLVLPYIEKSFSTVGHFLATFCWLINYMGWISYHLSYLNYAIYFRHVQKIKHSLCLRPFSVFIYGKFISNYSLHFSLLSSLQIIHLISDQPVLFFFWGGGRGGIGGYSVAAKFQRWILTLTHFSNVFFPNCKLYVSGLKITPCFKHGQCSIWGFLVFVFLKSASLTTTYFF